MKSVVQRLYDSEINAQISWLWDGRFDVRLGDGLNGWVARDNCDSWAAVETWLTEAACKHFPTSGFARAMPAPQFRSQLNPITQHEPDHSHDSGELPRR